MLNLNLDTDLPDRVADILREAAQAYRESQSELASAWTDPNAGKVWGDFATILERAAESCDKAYARRLG